jgi:hypothetical protein
MSLVVRPALVTHDHIASRPFNRVKPKMGCLGWHFSLWWCITCVFFGLGVLAGKARIAQSTPGWILCRTRAFYESVLFLVSFEPAQDALHGLVDQPNLLM